MSILSRAFLGLSLLLLPGVTWAFDESPVFPTDAIVRTEVFSRDFGRGNPQHDGGVAIVVDSNGNYYLASGATVSKYSSAGALIWTRTHNQIETKTTVGGLEQWNYYENWGDGSGNINQASTHDEGEKVTPFAQQALLDDSGNLYVYFIDLIHSERGLVVKFNPSGTVLWRNVTDFPQEGNCDSLLVDMVLTPAEDQLVLFEVVRNYTYSWKKTRLVVFSADTAQSDRNNEWVLSKLYGAPRAGETNGHNAIGAGLALNSEGDLCFAIHEGRENADLGATAAVPDMLVIRRLPAPYGTGNTTTNSETKLEFASPRKEEEWNDLG